MERRALIAGIALGLVLAARPAWAEPAASAASAPAPVGAPDVAPAPRVAALGLVLPPGEDRTAAAGFVAISPGDVLSTRAVRRTVQRLFLTGRYRNVQVRALPAPAPAGQAGSWVRLVIEAFPARHVERVEVRLDVPGAPTPAVLAAAARLEAGEPFDDTDLRAAADRVRALLVRRGWRGARVTASAEGEARVVVTLEVTAGSPTRVRRVVASGEPGGASGLLEVVATRAGERLDEDRLEADVRALRAALHEAGFRRGRVGEPSVQIEGDLADVTVPVFAGPRVVFAFRGNAALPSALLLRQLALEEGQPVDAAALDAAADRLRAAYRARGFTAARVATGESRRGDELAIVFRIDEGRRYRLRRVSFDGPIEREGKALAGELFRLLDAGAPDPVTAEADAARALVLTIPGARPPPPPPPVLPAREHYEEAAWDRAVEQIVDGYRAEGWLEAVYLGAGLALDGAARTADVTLRLREGPRTLVEGIAFEGVKVFALPDLAREARLAPGEPLSFERVEETRAALLRRYVSRGHAWARVEAHEDVDRERRLATVRFVVDEGPRATIGRVVVTGNRRTREEVVRGALEVKEGEPYDPEAMARSQAALLRLGVFRQVNLRLQEPDAPQEVKDVAVELSERPYATLTQGVGFSIANGPRAIVEYIRPNVLGRAIETTWRGKVNYPVNVLDLRPDISAKKPSERVEGRADVGIRSPRFELLPVPAGVRSDVVGEILHRRAYDLRRVSGAVGLDVGFTSRIGASIQYEVEVDDIQRTNVLGILTQADVERLRFDEGVTTLHAVRPSVAIDYRDNAAHPHRGWFAAGALEWARSLGSAVAGGPDARPFFGLLPASQVKTHLIKLSGTLSGYLPIGKASVLALSLRGGRVFPLDRDSRTIIPRRFFLGGASTMRGFAEEEMIQQDVRPQLAAEGRACATGLSGVGCTERGRRIAAGQLGVSEGGEAFLLGKVELRLGLTQATELGLFFDLGNVWLDPLAFSVLQLRPNAGAGIRINTPIGPVALDLGFNLQPDRAINERVFAPHFTIGLF